MWPVLSAIQKRSKIFQFYLGNRSFEKSLAKPKLSPIRSPGSGFVKYTKYLIGDILAVSPAEISWLAVLFLAVLVYWCLAGNALILTSVNRSLARSRRIKVFLLETSFTILLAVVVMLSIRLVGVLIINSLLVLPAAASRNFARDTRAYTLWAVIFSVVSGAAGLVMSYYWGTASGATIVLFSVGCYLVSVVAAHVKKRECQHGTP